MEHLEKLAERLLGARAPTAVREPEDVLARHLADSLIGLELEEVRSSRLAADLGSGAGLPGLALAACLPETSFQLVESQASRCSYLAATAAGMGIANARVVCSRAEEWAQGIEANDLVVARALAPQAVVMEYAAPLLALGGHLVEWRGRREAAEEAQAERAAALLGLTRQEIRHVVPFPDALDRHLHVFRKTDRTPDGFPRRPGLASRRPLAAESS
ncbi:MAG TPA: 16S rRNA (guanine(527)-N(7))-methyltransferase RsmG [Solirubrobacteraceae bacterium]|jgi:16S rRNA (guanine527-N7)-methyltransferase|nr:16S rRNA (guanine(527)-N(7))-methyltransferase RsmG [Solirubrobacteraceae bacterium]